MQCHLFSVTFVESPWLRCARSCRIKQPIKSLWERKQVPENALTTVQRCVDKKKKTPTRRNNTGCRKLSLWHRVFSVHGCVCVCDWRDLCVHVYCILIFVYSVWCIVIYVQYTLYTYLCTLYICLCTFYMHSHHVCVR